MYRVENNFCSIARCIVLSGCICLINCKVAQAGSDQLTDVTNDKQYWGGYKVGAEYELTAEMFFGRSAVSEADGALLQINPPRRATHEFPPTSRPSRAEFDRDPSKFPDILGLLRLGQHIKVDKVIIRRSTETSWIEIVGLIVGGKFDGKRIFLHTASNRANPDDATDITLKPNTSLIKEVQKTTSKPSPTTQAK